MRSRSGRSGLLLLAAVVAVVGALTAGAVWHGKPSADPKPDPHMVPRGDSQHVRPHAVLFGMSDPEFAKETARVQARQLARMRSIGINSLRFDANWDYVQYGGPQSFDWRLLDREVRSVRAAGMTVDLVIDGCPSWAALAGTSGDNFPQPASARRFAAWAGDVARRYARQGVNDFEIWNEPNDTKFWQPKANPAFYTRMLADSYRAIKRADGKAFIIGGDLAPVTSHGGSLSATDFLSAMYAHGAKPYFNAISTHPYTFPTLPGTFEPWSPWSQMSETTPSLRGIMKNHGDWRKPIWITEFGAPSNGPTGVGARGEAAEISQAITIAKSTRWIGAIFVYTWQDAGTNTRSDADWFGLLTSRARPKAAYWALAKAIGRR